MRLKRVRPPIDPLPFGAVCLARCSAPARSLGNGRCLFISCCDNSLTEDQALPPQGGEERFPLPADDELAQWRPRNAR